MNMTLSHNVSLLSLDDVVFLPVHEFADSFPMLDEAGLTALAASVAAGLREPLVIWNGVLLDGRNRRAAAHRANLVEVPVIEFVGTEDEAHELVVDLNVHRRHLSAGQRAYVAALHWAWESDRAKARQGTRTDLNMPGNFPGGSGDTGDTRDVLSARFRVDGRYIDAIRAMQKDSTELGSRLLNEIREGRSMNDALTEWRGRLKAQADPRREEYVAPTPAVPDEEYRAYVESQDQAEREIAEHWDNPERTEYVPETDEVRTVIPSTLPTVETSTPRQRASAEAMRQMFESDAHIRSHALTDQDILELRGKPHTVAGTAERMSEWYAMVAEAIRLNSGNSR